MKKKIAMLMLAGVLAFQTPLAVVADTVSENSVTTQSSDGETEESEAAENATVSENGMDDPEPVVIVSGNSAEEVPKVSSFGLGYHDIDKEAPDFSTTMPERAAYPSAYRSDRVDVNGDGVMESTLPALRNQNPYGTCWAFAAIGACEANLIRKGLADTNIDLSESHLAYFFYNKAVNVGDLRGNTVGDYNRCDAFTNYLDAGGNTYMTMWHLAGWAGVTSESRSDKFKYSNVNPSLVMDNNAATIFGSDDFHVQDCTIVNTNDTYSMKAMIMKNGSLAMSYCSDDEYDSKYHDGTRPNAGDEGSYYCPYSENTNHAIQVVGWDDNYNAKNFTYTPPGNGAWLIKNSWGEEKYDSGLGQQGYFWISYYDKTISEDAFAFDCESATNYNNIYQYDGSSFPNSHQCTSVANVFTANANRGYDELLQSVSIGVDDANVNYRVDVYTFDAGTNVTAANLTKGYKESTQNGTFTHAGYHTVKLNTPVTLFAGQKYAVVFTFTNGKAYANYDRSYAAGWINFTTTQTTGQSFYLPGEAYSWRDAGSEFATFRIKAFTGNMTYAPVSAVTLNKASLSLDKKDKATLKGTVIGGNGRMRTSWTTSNKKVATVSNGVVTAKGYGTAVITFKAANGKTAACTVNVKTTDASNPIIASGESVTSSKIKLKLAPAYNATGYEIYKSTSKNGAYKLVKTLKGKKKVNFNDTKVSCGNTYYYKVKCIKKGGKKSSFSKVYKVKATPAKVSIKKVTSSAKITWKKVAKASGYEIFRATSPASKGKKIATVNGKTSYKDKKAKKGTTYYYKVRAYQKVKGKKVYGSFSEVKSTNG